MTPKRQFLERLKKQTTEVPPGLGQVAEDNWDLLLRSAYPSVAAPAGVRRRMTEKKAAQASAQPRRRKRTWILASATMALALALGALVVWPRAVAATVVRQMRGAVAEVTSAHYRIYEIEEEGHERLKGEVWYTADRSRQETEGRVYITQGQRLWTYFPGEETAYVETMDEHQPLYRPSGFTVEKLLQEVPLWGGKRDIRVQKDRWNGRPTQKVIIEDVNGLTRYVLWADPATGLPFRAELQEGVEPEWEVREYHLPTYNEPLPPDLFTLHLPKGVPLIDRDAARAALEQHLRTPLATQSNGDLTVSLVHLEVNRTGDVFLLCTVTQNSTGQEGALLTGIRITDSRGTRYYHDSQHIFWRNRRSPAQVTYRGKSVLSLIAVPAEPVESEPGVKLVLRFDGLEKDHVQFELERPAPACEVLPLYAAAVSGMELQHPMRVRTHVSPEPPRDLPRVPVWARNGQVYELRLPFVALKIVDRYGMGFGWTTEGCIYVGQEFQIQIIYNGQPWKGRPEECPVRFRSLTPEVLTVSEDGRVKAKAGGRAEVLVERTGGNVVPPDWPKGRPAPPRSHYLTLVVADPTEANLRVTAPRRTINVGETIRLKATAVDVKYQRPHRVSPTWRSNDPEAATVDAQGRVTGKTRGQATIEGVLPGGVESSVWIRVCDPHATTPDPIDTLPKSISSSVRIDGSLYTGHTIQIHLTFTDPRTGKPLDIPVTWRSKTPALATVDQNGVVTGLRPGHAEIEYEWGGQRYVKRIQVEATSFVDVRLSRDHLKAGQSTWSLAQRVQRNQGQYQSVKLPNVTWRSSDPTVATVSKRGKVMTHRPGRVQIIATAAEGEEGQATLTVE